MCGVGNSAVGLGLGPEKAQQNQNRCSSCIGAGIL